MWNGNSNWFQKILVSLFGKTAPTQILTPIPIPTPSTPAATLVATVKEVQKVEQHVSVVLAVSEGKPEVILANAHSSEEVMEGDIANSLLSDERDPKSCQSDDAEPAKAILSLGPPQTMEDLSSRKRPLSSDIDDTDKQDASSPLASNTDDEEDEPCEKKRRIIMSL